MKKEKWVDDGCTIVSMDVPGMPPRRTRASAGPVAQDRMPFPVMDSRDTRRYVLTAMAAGLLVALVFVGVIVLFTLFALHVWLK